jgi:putative alpha-1,2-mannosidase
MNSFIRHLTIILSFCSFNQVFAQKQPADYVNPFTGSAWYVFSAMGFYPDCPGKPEYRIGSPLFDKIEIKLNKDFYPGKTFVLSSNPKNTDKSRLMPAKLNNKKFRQFSITHEQIVQGGELKFKAR